MRWGLISMCKYVKNSLEEKGSINGSWYWVQVYALQRSQIMIGTESNLQRWIIYKEYSR